MTDRQTGAGAGRRAAVRAAAVLCVFALVIGLVILFPPDNAYLWLKAAHIVAVISWMAGLLYLPRLFVYHSDAPKGSALSETLKVMERRLFSAIMRPAMGLAWLLGLYLAWSVHGFAGGWLHAKLLLVLLLSGVHEFYGRAVKAFARDENRLSGRAWRLWNEVPAVLMVLIVVIVVVKPF